MKLRNTLLGSAVSMVLAAPVYAQAALTGVQGLDTRIDDIQTGVGDDIARGNDTARYGVNQFAQGWDGSLSFGLGATAGNTDTTDLSIGGRFRYGAGPWNHTLGFAGEFAEVDGVTVQEEMFVTYDANRYFDDQLYVFALGSVRYDGFATNEWDAFVGIGPGYRVLNEDNMTWRLQVGPGVRYTVDRLGMERTELAGIFSSRFFFELNDALFLTNDTDVLTSEMGTLASNEFGINYQVTDALTTRISYRTDYDSAPLPGFENTDGTFGLSLVVGF